MVCKICNAAIKLNNLVLMSLCKSAYDWSISALRESIAANSGELSTVKISTAGASVETDSLSVSGVSFPGMCDM